MQVSITGRHVDLTDPLKAYVNDKLGHLKHSFDHVVDVHVVLTVEKHRQRCEINMAANGITIHAKHETDDMYAAIDGVVDKLNRQLKRYRAKLQRHQGSQRKTSMKLREKFLDVAHGTDELTEAYQPDTLADEVVDVQVMSMDEAVMKMELSEKDNVLLFTNEETGKLNALTRRPDGSLSWIEPEAA
ncbi:MAG: ribosome-associated translation inhibitor RaiA [Ghiorsea sp.]|nr:ribosome-associated translation inhibitor RaiA [Ghiorsea sp.]